MKAFVKPYYLRIGVHRALPKQNNPWLGVTKTFTKVQLKNIPVGGEFQSWVAIGDIEQISFQSPLEGLERATTCQWQWNRLPKAGSTMANARLP